MILSPHSDDGLLGAGATISRFVEEGRDVTYAIFAPNGQGFEDGEIENALVELGLGNEKIIKQDFPVRHFTEHRQAILEWMLQLRKELQPELVLCHSTADTHQDHNVVRQEAFRAFKHHSIWGYDLPWNTRNFSSDIFVPLRERNVEKKLKAIAQFVSQKERPYYNLEIRKAHLIANGEKITKRYCEVFEGISQVL